MRELKKEDFQRCQLDAHQVIKMPALLYLQISYLEFWYHYLRSHLDLYI